MLAGDGTARISARSDGIMNKITMFQHSDDFESFTAGQIVFREGDAADRMYVVLDGKVELSIHGKKVDDVETGDAFGEMALIDEAPRSATATALTDCKLVPIDAKRFNFLVQQTPRFALQIMRIMSDRLRHRDP